MMNVSDSASEISSYHKLIKGTTFFYSVPHDTETALIKRQNAMHAIVEISQRYVSDCYDRNNNKLNAKAKDHETIEYENRK